MKSLYWIFSRGIGIGVFVVGMLLAGVNPASASDQVNVRFSWKLKGEYAPLYLAKQNSAFKSRDLTVRLGEGAGSQAALSALIQGQEDIVIMPGIFALSAIQRGIPVKIIALYQPRAPIVFISHLDDPIIKPKQLEGNTIARSVGETGTAYLDVFCKINHVDCSKVSTVMMNSQSRIPQFLQNKVDAVSVYLDNDLPLLEAKTRVKYPELRLSNYGMVLPGMAAVSSNNDIAKRPDVLRRFLAAVNDGIAAAKKRPVVAARAMRKDWNGAPNVKIITKQVEATVAAMPSNKNKPLGWINNNDISASLGVLEKSGQISKPKQTNAFYTNKLLVR